MTVHFFTESTCDLPESVIRGLSINVFPLYININDLSYLDIDKLSRKVFYLSLSHLHSYPTTTAPSPTAFVSEYKEIRNL